MKTSIRLAVSLTLFSIFAVTAVAKDLKIKWRGTVEFKDLEQAKKDAVSEKKFLTILVSNAKYDSDTQGAQATVDVIEDTIKGLKNSSIIVRSSVDQIRGLTAGEPFNTAASEGFQKAGNSLPMIIIINPATNKLVKVIQPNDVHQEGSKAFRDIKKAARDLKK